MLPGFELRLEGSAEQVGEVAFGELGAHVSAVTSLLERVGVGRCQGHARARVAEDAADLGDVEADVDDQMAGEGVAWVVETQPSPVAIEAASTAARRGTRLETLWCKNAAPRVVANA